MKIDLLISVTICLFIPVNLYSLVSLNSQTTDAFAISDHKKNISNIKMLLSSSILTNSLEFSPLFGEKG